MYLESFKINKKNKNIHEVFVSLMNVFRIIQNQLKNKNVIKKTKLNNI